MSLRTWRASYCPVTPNAVGRRSWMYALKHAHRYYTGMSDKNTARHGLKKMGNILVEPDTGKDHAYGFGSNAVCFKSHLVCSGCVLSSQGHRRLCKSFDPVWMIDKITSVIKELKGRGTV